MAKQCQLPLFTVGSISILVFSNLDSDHKDVHNLDNSPTIINGSSEDIPFMFFTDKLRDETNHSVKKAIREFVNQVNIREVLDFSKFDKVGNPTAWGKNEKMKDAFTSRINGSDLASARKAIYKATACPKSMLNIDGILLSVSRCKGDVRFSVDMPVTERVMYSSSRLDNNRLIFHRKYWGECVDKVFDENECIKSVERYYWPKNLKPKLIDIYSGYRQDKQPTEAEVKP